MQLMCHGIIGGPLVPDQNNKKQIAYSKITNKVEKIEHGQIIGIFKCKFCVETFTTLDQLYQHVK